MLVKIVGFDGLQPAADSRLLDQNKATAALNTRLVNGTLRSWKSAQFIATCPKIGEVKTIYRFGQNNADDFSYWLNWLVDVDVIRGPVADNTTERTYWTGETWPMYSYYPTILAGSDLPAAAYRLGIPRPETSPNATAGARPALD